MSHRKHRHYWKRFLLPNETLVHTFGISGRYIFIFWIVPAMVVFAIATYTILANPFLGGLVFVVALGMLLPPFFMGFFVHYAITDVRVVSRRGIFHKYYVTADLHAVTDVTIFEPFLERLFTNSGIVGVNTAGSDSIEVVFQHVSKPYEIRQDIYKHLQRVRLANGAAYAAPHMPKSPAAPPPAP
jgi:uncharacterized membrane protein YdbT with pleckstrin-like domain